MKKTFAIALTLVSTSCFAATGHGYRVYGGQIHADPKFNYHIEHIPLDEKKSPNEGSVLTTIPSRGGRAGEYIQVDAYHDFWIHNNTGDKQTYKLYVEINCATMKADYTEYVDIEEGGEYRDRVHDFGVVQTDVLGYHKIEGNTQFLGESSASNYNFNYLNVMR